ncbi:MAG: hypothetical protein V4687_02965 [Bacteroidota bacterium]
MTTNFKLYRRVILLVSSFLMLIHSAYAQDHPELKRNLDRFHVSYVKPKGYKEIDSIFKITSFETGHLVGVSRYNLLSEDGKMMICVYFSGPIDTVGFRTLKLLSGKIYDVNKNYIPHNLSYELHSSSYSKKVYNADVSGFYDFPPGRLVHILGPSEKCVTVFMHKENRLDIEVYYYYMNLSDTEVKKHLKRTEAMFKFLD